ncbi:MAG: VOC family protein [Actinopolymorphaceae bacterium]
MNASNAPSFRASLAPWLAVERPGAAIDFYQAAFGAVERYRLEDDAGHVAVARLAIGGAEFWLQESDRGPVGASSRTVLTVDDPDAMFAQAVDAGATAIAAVADQHGWRTGRLADPFGHHWDVAAPLDDLV